MENIRIQSPSISFFYPILSLTLSYTYINLNRSQQKEPTIGQVAVHLVVSFPYSMFPQRVWGRREKERGGRRDREGELEKKKKRKVTKRTTSICNNTKPTHTPTQHQHQHQNQHQNQQPTTKTKPNLRIQSRKTFNISGTKKRGIRGERRRRSDR